MCAHAFRNIAVAATTPADCQCLNCLHNTNTYKVTGIHSIKDGRSCRDVTRWLQTVHFKILEFWSTFFSRQNLMNENFIIKLFDGING